MHRSAQNWRIMEYEKTSLMLYPTFPQLQIGYPIDTRHPCIGLGKRDTRELTVGI